VKERDRCGLAIPESGPVGRCRECENRRLLVRFFFPSSSYSVATYISKEKEFFPVLFLIAKTLAGM
jgi:hypothetical protein